MALPPANPMIVVLEKAPRLSPPIRRQVAGGGLSVREVRTPSSLNELLEASPISFGSVVVADFAAAPGHLMLTMPVWKQTVPEWEWVVLLDRTRPELEWPLRELGVRLVDFFPEGIDRVARYCGARTRSLSDREGAFAQELLARNHTVNDGWCGPT